MRRAMNGWVWVVGLALAWAGGALLAGDINLIPNGGFEAGDGAKAASWDTETGFGRRFRASGYSVSGKDAARDIVFERDAKVRRAGRYSGHIHVVNGPKQQATACWLSRFVAVDPTQRYLFRLYVKTHNTRYAFAILFEYDQAGKFLSSRLYLHPKMTIGPFAAWQEKTYVIEPGMWNPNTAKVRVTLNVTTEKGKTCDVWFDDVTLARFEPRDLPAIRRALDDSPPPKAAADYRRRNILFYASFDGKNLRADADFAQGLREPLTALGVRFERGVHGKAIHLTTPAGRLVYRASRNLYAQRGTVAFWFKIAKPRGYGPFYVSAAEEGVSRHMMSTSVRRGRGASMSDAQGATHQVGAVDASGRKPGQWIHYAYVWDQNYGARVHINGKRHRSTWGKKAWDECLHPSQIRIGSWHGSRTPPDLWMDELYIFGKALTDREIAAVYQNRLEGVGVRRKPYALGPKAAARRLAAAGIRKDTPLVELTAARRPAGRRLLVRVARIASGKQKTVTTRWAMDGIEGSYWPSVFFPGDAFDIYLEPPYRANYVALSGAFSRCKLLTRNADGSWRADRPLVDSGPRRGGTFRARLSTTPARVIRYQLPRTRRHSALSEIRFAEVSETDAGTGSANDRALRFSPRAEPADFGPLGRAPLDLWQRRYHRGMPHAQEPGPMSRSIVSLYPPADRAMLVANAAPAGSASAGSVRLGPLQHCQLFSQTFAEPVPVDSITLRLRVSRLVDGDTLRLRVREPMNLFRNVMKMDLRVRNRAAARDEVWLEMTLDIPDQVVLPGQRMWIDVAFAKGAEMFYGPSGASEMILSCPDPEKSRREFVKDQIKLIHSRYTWDAERHMWDAWGWELTSRAFRFANNEEIYLATRAALAVEPQNPLALKYWRRLAWLPFNVKIAPAGRDKAPEWARLQRELMWGATRIVRWWIDNRQMADGQLGGHWGDDVETAAMWPPLALIAGDEKVTRGLEKIADGIWSDATEIDQEKGYTIRVMDVEHASEPTTCSQPHMMLLRYGDPEYIERNMRAARNIGVWTAINPQGRRLFRSYMFNARRLSDKGFHAADVPDNAQVLRAAFYVAWYNRNPQILKWFKEYGESWLQASLSTEGGKPRGFVPQEIVFKTGKIGGFSGHWSKSVYPGSRRAIYHQFLANYCLLGDRRYLDFLRKYDSRRPALYWTIAGESPPARPVVALAKMRSNLRRLLGTELLVTWAEPPTDRINIPGLGAATTGYLGMWWTRACYPLLAASYEGGGTDFAARVIENSGVRLKILLYNFRPTPMKLGVRVWHLQNGTYDARLGPDANADHKIDRPTWTRSMRLGRYSLITIPLPPGRLQVLEARQTLRGEALETRADLAIGPRDVRLDSKAGAVRVTVHNVGSTDARSVAVHLLDAAGRRVAEAGIPLLRAPLDLTPKAKTVSLKIPADIARQIYLVSVDPANRVPEITESNNRLPIHIGR